MVFLILCAATTHSLVLLQIVGELVTGCDVPYVRKEGTELYMPLKNLSGVVLVELVPEVTLRFIS